MPTRRLADRHDSQQSPGSSQFVPPGRCVVLRTAPADALWVTRGPVFSQHAWRDAWITNLFRNESVCLSSTLIRQAVAVTYVLWPTIPAQDMITSVNPPIRALYAAAIPPTAIGVPASGM